MATRHNPDSIVTESRMAFLMDGWTILAIATFKDGKNMGITIYNSKYKHKEISSWHQ